MMAPVPLEVCIKQRAVIKLLTVEENPVRVHMRIQLVHENETLNTANTNPSPQGSQWRRRYVVFS